MNTRRVSLFGSVPARTARRALGAFDTPPPRGVRTAGPRGGTAYLQYSFAPRLYIFHAFLQSLIGLHDFARITGNDRALRLYHDAEPEARALASALTGKITDPRTLEDR